ncbi:MAG: cytochrome P450 [Pseudonocardiaceae bacterium]|nr:cytochrome P450 [Pseudonocardiaceae bacterium]
MSRNELSLALRPWSFLDSHVHLSDGVVEVRTKPQRKLLVWHPETISWIFRSDQRLAHPGSRAMIPLLGQHSMLWADGERHATYRRVLGAPIRGRRLASYRHLISDTVHRAIDDWVPGTIVPLVTWTHHVALQIIAQIVLGRPDDSMLAQFTAWLDRAFGSRSRTLFYRYLRDGLPRPGHQLDDALVRNARATATTDSSALATVLLTEDGPLGKLSDPEVRDQLVSLLFAGHETTAGSTAWTLYLLDRHERIRRDVIDELNATNSDGSDATQVPLLNAVIQETLRLKPPVPAAENRQLTEDGELFGGQLAAGTILAPSIYLAHHKPDYFPNPHQFDPHRFLAVSAPRNHYFPFGGGSRHCLGSQLAQMETRMIVTALLRRREWHCVNPKAGTPQLRVHTMAPAPKLRMMVTRCRE